MASLTTELVLPVVLVMTLFSSLYQAAPVAEGKLPNLSKIRLLREKLGRLEHMLERLVKKDPSKPEVGSTAPPTTPAVAPSVATTMSQEDRILDALVANLTPQDITVLRHIKAKLEDEVGPGVAPERQEQRTETGNQEKIAYGNFLNGNSEQGTEQFLERPLPDDQLGLTSVSHSDETGGMKRENGESDKDRDNLLKIVEERLMSDVDFAKSHGLQLKDLIDDLGKNYEIPDEALSNEEDELNALKKD